MISSNLRICLFLVSFSVILSASQNAIFEAREKLPYNHYRIVNDPDQVKPEKMTLGNLFGWLNLKNVVRFKLWTRKNPVLAHEIKYQDLDSLLTSNFDPQRLTKVIIHGYADTATEQATTYYLIHMRDAYLKLADVNVIIVDHTLFTLPIFYWTTLPELTAKRLAEMLTWLSEMVSLTLDSVHLIGFSLGAHVAGVAGKLLNGTIGRISGLDPAGPSFRFLPDSAKLDKTDALFVDIIHTNGGKSLFFGGYLGYLGASGHVDHFPNGGERQIGCPQTNVLVYETIECSHGRAARYFIESINSPLAFPSCKCEDMDAYVRGGCGCGPDDLNFMGEHVSFRSRGIYQLITRAKSPFGHGPAMSVSAPNMTSYYEEGSNRLSRSSRADFNLPGGNTTVTFEGRAMSFPMNPFDPTKYPNDDVIKLCLKVYSMDANATRKGSFSKLYKDS